MATAHAIIVIAYHVLAEKLPYREFGSDFFTRLNENYVKHNLIRRLEAFGLIAVPKPLAASIA